MSIQSFFVRTVVILRANSGEDRYGNQARDWTDSITVTTVKGWLAPVTSQTEHNVNREESEVKTWLYLPSGTDVEPTDRCTVDGVLYQVVAWPADAWTPFGSHHLEVRVERIDG